MEQPNDAEIRLRFLNDYLDDLDNLSEYLHDLDYLDDFDDLSVKRYKNALTLFPM